MVCGVNSLPQPSHLTNITQPGVLRITLLSAFMADGVGEFVSQNLVSRQAYTLTDANSGVAARRCSNKAPTTIPAIVLLNDMIDSIADVVSKGSRELAGSNRQRN